MVGGDRHDLVANPAEIASNFGLYQVGNWRIRPETALRELNLAGSPDQVGLLHVRHQSIEPRRPNRMGALEAMPDDDVARGGKAEGFGH